MTFSTTPPVAFSGASSDAFLGTQQAESAAASGAEPPQHARDTTAEHPWPVRLLSQKFHNAVAKWPEAWIAGQIVEINTRRSSTAYLTLQDNMEDITISVMGWSAFASKARTFHQGDRVVLHGKPDVWVKATRLSFVADDIRRTGEGDLKAQIDALRQRLKGEGLFDDDRKLPLPEFPHRIGLICAPGARAEGDVITNVNLRWVVPFTVAPAYVQGAQCPPSVIAALQQLDADPEVDVIIVARGGGAFTDLIGFSDEGVVRAVAACHKPVISAIGHEDDWTLIDLVADMRASTPTDAAKRVVPDVHEQIALVNGARERLLMRLENMLTAESRLIEGYANRPSLTTPLVMLEPHERFVADATERMRRGLTRLIDEHSFRIDKLATSLRALSPQATLNRGYAVVQNAQGGVIDNASSVAVGESLTITLHHGKLQAQATATSD